MRIAFSGTNGVGKTTLLNELRKDDYYNLNFEFASESTRDLKKLGFNINESGNSNTQVYILNTHITNLLKDNCIFDRCLADGLAYSKWLDVDEEIIFYADYLVENYIQKYDVIFYLPIEFEVEDDGVRSINNNFRNEVDVILQDTLKGLTNVIELRGSVEDRLKIVKEHIQLLEKIELENKKDYGKRM